MVDDAANFDAYVEETQGDTTVGFEIYSCHVYDYPSYVPSDDQATHSHIDFGDGKSHEPVGWACSQPREVGGTPPTPPRSDE